MKPLSEAYAANLTVSVPENFDVASDLGYDHCGGVERLPFVRPALPLEGLELSKRLAERFRGKANVFRIEVCDTAFGGVQQNTDIVVGVERHFNVVLPKLTHRRSLREFIGGVDAGDTSGRCPWSHDSELATEIAALKPGEDLSLKYGGGPFRFKRLNDTAPSTRDNYYLRVHPDEDRQLTDSELCAIAGYAKPLDGNAFSYVGKHVRPSILDWVLRNLVRCENETEGKSYNIRYNRKTKSLEGDSEPGFPYVINLREFRPPTATESQKREW